MFHVIYYFQVIRIYIKREAPISWPCKNYAIEPMKTFLDGQYSIPNYQREYSWEENEIQDFLNDTERLKQLLKLTKETDSFYLQKRNISEDYDPLGAYAFENWKQYFNDEIRGRYETLHEDLLYTSNRQCFEKAIQAFEFISHLFASIGE